MTYYRLPWRALPDRDRHGRPEVVEPTPPEPPAAKPDAYAESP